MLQLRCFFCKNKQ